MQALTLGATMREAATRFPDNTGFLVPGKGGFTRVPYREVWTIVRRYAAVLRKMGLQRGDRVSVLSENCVEWAYTDWACQSLGLILVPIYPTLPADQAQYIAHDAGAKLVVAGDAKQMAKVSGLPEFTAINLKELDATAAATDPLDEADLPIDDIKPEDVATIIYTSGTTGDPKGAMISHRAYLHVCRAATDAISLTQKDVFLCFLPMSHVFERVAGQILPVFVGATLGYAKNLASLSHDLLEVKPTLFMCVPRFLESVMDRVLDKVSKDKPIRQKLFWLAYSQGLKKFKGEFAPLAGILDKLVAVKIRERLGGRMRFLVSGGAALPTNIAEFYLAMGIELLQGYGLTETTGGSFVNRPGSNKYWTVGEALDMEVKIATDGEILVRGPAIMNGYYNRPDETSKAIDSEGWFHTGDIGELEGKCLKITDRKKDLIVLGNGKNVAPQPIENKLKESKYIAEAVVMGDGMDSCIALFVPNSELLRTELGLPEDTTLSEHPAAKAVIKREIDATNKTLASFEAIKRWAILDQPFTIDGGELTPTLKVKRKVIKERYAKLIAELAR